MRKEVLKTLVSEMEKKESEHSILKWIELNKIKTEKGTPITFDRHPFLIDIYNDFTPVQVQEKSSQVGMSTTAILKTFFLGKTKDYNVIHTLPTSDFSLDFVKSKVDPIIKANSEIFNINKKKDSTRHKQIGLSHFFYRGTFTEKEGITISSDLVINDEYDRSDLKVVGVFESRLDFSEYKGKWRFSNPSVPQYGIDALWEGTKQFHWFIKCSHCGRWQFMKWPESLDFKKKVFICIHCKREIYDEDRINGMWIPKYKDREINGYRISQLFCVWHDAREILHKHDSQDKDVFYNFTLGVPYIGSDVSVRRQHVLRCVKDNELSSKHETSKVMGIDQGGTFHIVSGGLEGIDMLYTVGTWDDVRDIIAKVKPVLCVIDGLPETSKVHELQDKFGSHVVFSAFYKDNPEDPRIIRWEKMPKGRKYSSIYIDRFRSLDDLIREVYEAKIKIFLQYSSPMIEILINHFESMYRTQRENKHGQLLNMWNSSTKNDHFVHAMNYWRAAMLRLKTYEKIQEQEDDEAKRPYSSYETPDERMARYKQERDNMGDIPSYLIDRKDYP